jgi:hypothetical protein
MIILFLLIVALIIASSFKKTVPQGAQANFIVEDIPKFCPPHKWRYLEIKDTEGTTVKWRLICDLCGPLKPQNGPARLE